MLWSGAMSLLASSKFWAWALAQTATSAAARVINVRFMQAP
jgi:hypothetical protein